MIKGRAIVIDTETTGLFPDKDRVIEVGAVELVNALPTENTFHRYINPGCLISDEAAAVHGISNNFLEDYPPFSDIADDLLAFLADSPLIIHNASFDMKFLNAELARNGFVQIENERAFCTLALARKKYPRQQNSLDALCNRFGIDTSKRSKHGALIDAQLLAELYIEFFGGRQMGLALVPDQDCAAKNTSLSPVVRLNLRPRPHAPTEAEQMAHALFIKRDLVKSIWLLGSD